MSAPEILAPAGSADALKAAVQCGAAAVYLGGSAFNARQHAENFDGAALRAAIEYCHIRGVQVHFTLNTLLCGSEIPAALALARHAAACGADALIVQDVGLARLLRAAVPALPLHASTQLSCHTPDGVRFLRDNGFSRVVLSREMTKEEIAACAGLGCELEVFVHGALCMSVSGQCYFSAALGGRSGNRGVCAQPCRLPFSAPHTAGLTGGYTLSLKDAHLAQHIAALSAAGVTSFKIEGRMKRPEYVAAATAVCRDAANGKPVSAGALRDLEAVFSRSGFTDGYYTGKRGTAMFGIRRREDVTAAAPVLRRLAATYAREQQTVPVTLHLQADAGIPVRLTVSDRDGHTLTVTGAPAETARTAATPPQKAAAQLEKTGDTPYLATATAAIGADTALSAAALNALRREALGRLSAVRAAVDPPLFTDALPPPPTAAPRMPGRVVRLADAAQYSAALREETVILPLFTDKETLSRIRQQHWGALGAEIPRGLFGLGDAVAKALAAAKAAGAAWALCGNINAIPATRAAGLSLLGGFGMNITSVHAVDFFAQNGLAAAVLSPELSLAQTAFAADAPIPCGVFLYGRLPLMLTRNCPRRAAGADCRRCRKDGVLQDRRNVRFPVMCQNGCAEILNSVPTYLSDKRGALPAAVFSYLHFTTEPAERVAEILRRDDERLPADEPITRGMAKRGVL